MLFDDQVFEPCRHRGTAELRDEDRFAVRASGFCGAGDKGDDTFRLTVMVGVERVEVHLGKVAQNRVEKSVVV